MLPNENGSGILSEPFFISNFALDKSSKKFIMKIKLFLIAILCGLGLFSIQGVSDGRDTPPVSSKATILGMKSNKHRPKAPSRVFVECVYGEDYMTFSFPGGISSYTVHIYNETDEWYSYVSEEKPTVNIPLFTGTYTLECTANDGRVFTGTVDF